MSDITDPGIQELRAHIGAYTASKPCAIFTRGIPCSGKTTLLRRLFPGTQVFSLDLMREMLHDDAEQMRDVGPCVEALTALMRERQAVSTTSRLLVDGTHMVPAHAEEILRHVRYRRRVLLDVYCDEDTYALNTAQRTDRVVPGDVVERMRQRQRDGQAEMMALFKRYDFHIVRVNIARASARTHDPHRYTYMRVYTHEPGVESG